MKDPENTEKKKFVNKGKSNNSPVDESSLLLFDQTASGISERRYKMLIEQTGLGIGYYSPDGIVKAFNKEALRNLGRSEEDFIGKNVKEIFGTIQGRIYINRFIQVAESDTPLQFEDRFVINGKPTWFKSTQSRIMNEAGEVDGIQVLAENISGIKIADQALIESEEKFKQITEKSVVGICIIQDSKLVYVNPTFSRMFGTSGAEMTSPLDLGDLFHPDDLILLLRNLKGRLNGKTPNKPSVYRAFRKDRSVFFIEAQSTRIQYHGRNAVMGSLIDITERRRMEEGLRKSELEYRGIFENSILGICQSLPSGRLLRVNKAYAEMFGFSSPEEMLKEVSDIGNQLYIDSSEVQKIIDFIYKDGFMAPAEIGFKRRNGQEFYALVGIKAVKGISGEILYLQAEQIDITDRKKAATDLTNSEFKYHIVADNTFDWEFWQTPKKEYLYHSPSCKRITGHDPEDFIKNPRLIEEIIHPEDLHIFINHQKEFQENRIPGQIEYRIIDSDNKIKWITHVCSPIFDKDGIFLGTRGSNRDSSDRKNAEIMLNNKVDELEQFNSLTINRELRMVELKNEVNELLTRHGETKKYRIPR